MGKIWTKTVIALDNQNVAVYPNEDYTGIIVETKELDDKTSGKLYLNQNEMELLVVKMDEMMNYVLE